MEPLEAQIKATVENQSSSAFNRYGDNFSIKYFEYSQIYELSVDMLNKVRFHRKSG